MTGDHRFEEVFANWTEGGPENMCEVLSRIEDRGIKKGRAEGRAEGISEMASILRGIGVNEEQIKEAVRISKERRGSL